MKKQPAQNKGQRRTVAEQVKGIFPNHGKNALPSMPHMWDGDGVDHINVHWAGETDLGKKLTLAAKPFKKVNNPLLGEFDSLQNFWAFVRAANPVDRMRTLSTRPLFTLITETGGNHPGIVNAKALLWEAAYLTFLQNTQLGEELMKNDLPFDSYDNTRSVLPVREKNAIWHSMALTEISNALREHRLPNFFTLLDKDYIQQHELHLSTYSARDAYAGIIDVFFKGKWPEKANLEKITADLQEAFYKDVEARKAAQAKPTDMSAAQVVDTAVEVDQEESPVNLNVDDNLQADVPFSSPQETGEENNIVLTDADVVNYDAPTSEAEALAYVQEISVATEVPLMVPDINNMPEDMRVEIQAIAADNGVIEKV